MLDTAGNIYFPENGCCKVRKVAPSAPEIDIRNNAYATSILDGAAASTSDDTDFGNVNVASSPSKSYTIRNTGSAVLTLSGTPDFACRSNHRYNLFYASIYSQCSRIENSNAFNCQ